MQLSLFITGLKSESKRTGIFENSWYILWSPKRKTERRKDYTDRGFWNGKSTQVQCSRSGWPWPYQLSRKINFFKKNNSFPKICNLVYNMVNFFMLQCNRNIVLLVRNVVNCILEIYLFKISRNPLDIRSSHFGCLYSLFLTGPSFICFLLALWPAFILCLHWDVQIWGMGPGNISPASKFLSAEKKSIVIGCHTVNKKLYLNFQTIQRKKKI